MLCPQNRQTEMARILRGFLLPIGSVSRATIIDAVRDGGSKPRNTSGGGCEIEYIAIRIHGGCMLAKSNRQTRVVIRIFQWHIATSLCVTCATHVQCKHSSKQAIFFYVTTAIAQHKSIEHKEKCNQARFIRHLFILLLQLLCIFTPENYHDQSCSHY